MYVVVTHAESHALFTARWSLSPLFGNLLLELTEIDPEVGAAGKRVTKQARLQVSVPVPDIPDSQSPHTNVDE